MCWGAVQEDACLTSVHVAGEGTANSMKGSSRLRWLPMAVLAIFAAADCTLQYSLAATNAASALHVPDRLLRFLTVRACQQWLHSFGLAASIWLLSPYE